MFHILTTVNLPLSTPYITDILREKKYLELFSFFAFKLISEVSGSIKYFIFFYIT